MIHIKQAIVVEGKYDKIKLSSIVDAVILVTNGFQIYKNPEQLDLIRYYARTTGVILMTDADRAGFQIRNYPKGACLLYTSPTPRDRQKPRMPSSA